ncbi:MAG: penicillin-binding protein 2 [Lachnospiraceae bacterium]|nr:penicillin-binding protein 2 [Lachnospiraceae bacterium]
MQSGRDEREKKNSLIARVTYVFVALFLAMIGYIGYFTYFTAPDFINSSYNSRQELYAKRVVRGKILSKNGEILAETLVGEDGSETRSYPYKNLFAHAVGYSQKGKTGVELLSNFTLLTSDTFLVDQLRNTLSGKKNIGDNVVTTLNVSMQAAAYKALSGYKGAILALDARTGEVLCMVSKPDFDPNRIVSIWEEINSDEENSPLLNRTTLGLYPPGSVFKIVTALEYMKENSPEEISEFAFDCDGSYTYEGDTINCYHGTVHGELDLNSAFSKSCNSAFASIGVTLDKKAFQKTCEELLFNRALPVRFPYKESFVPVNEDSDTGELMQTAIGQGRTGMSPLHMAMITQAIANNGLLMKPYIIDHVENEIGDVIKSYKPKELGRIIDEEYTIRLRELMRLVVTEGTATRLRDESFEAAGKTGSAEFSSNKAMSHAWFTGFAPAEDPEIVVTVIAEKAGSGGQIAAPMAGAVFDAYFR